MHSKEVIQLLGGQAKSRIFFRLCKNSLISNFWNLTFATVAFSAEFRNRPAEKRRRNFFSGGRRKNPVFSPREKSEFPLQECSVNLHYKIGAQIWSGNPAENRPSARPPRGCGRADGFANFQAEFAECRRNCAADGGGSGPGRVFRSPRCFARPRGPPVCQNARQRPVRDVSAPRPFPRRSLIFRIKNQGAC